MANAVARSWAGTPRLSGGLPPDWSEAEKRLQNTASFASKPSAEADFFQEFMDLVELEFGLDTKELEQGIRFGFSSLNEEEIWDKPLFQLAHKVGESLGLAKDRVKEELKRLLDRWDSVRWCQQTRRAA